MNKGTNFILRLAGLKDGTHSFEFELESKFFENIESPSLETGKLDLKVELAKSDSMLQIGLEFKGNLELICDRSLDVFTYPVSSNHKLFFKKGEHFEELAEDLWVIPSNLSELDLSDQIHDLVYLQIPVKCLHPRFDDDNGEDEIIFSTEAVIKEEIKAKEEKIDPRWAALNKLKNKD